MNREGFRLELGENIIRNEKRFLYLPFVQYDCAEVELILMDTCHYIVCHEDDMIPIKMGKYIGNRVHIGGGYNNSDMNPKFFWDESLKIWRMSCKGHVVFSEISLNEPIND